MMLYILQLKEKAEITFHDWTLVLHYLNLQASSTLVEVFKKLILM